MTDNQTHEGHGCMYVNAFGQAYACVVAFRQGQMARWVSGSGKWSDCHFILTRSGFLHWLADPQDVTPLGSLNLPKCQFEAGEAPKFNINEHQGGFFGKSKRMCFEASSVEDCCEWAIAVRETIAAHRGR